MKKVLITGAKGKIGRVLSKGLKNYDLTLVDLPETDVRNYEKFKKIMEGHDAVIHLAWNTKTENFLSKKADPNNKLMFENIYEAALETGVPRVIMASSIHADNFKAHKGKKLLNPNTLPKPANPYGVSKVIMEKMGKKYSRKGLEVVCIRLGAVGYGRDKSKEGRMVWFSNRDCVSLLETILGAKRIPNNFFIVHGVSNNQTRIHDYSNPLGWKPKDDSSRAY